jgi:hypothetical protein
MLLFRYDHEFIYDIEDNLISYESHILAYGVVQE